LSLFPERRDDDNEGFEVVDDRDVPGLYVGFGRVKGESLSDFLGCGEWFGTEGEAYSESCKG